MSPIAVLSIQNGYLLEKLDEMGNQTIRYVPDIETLKREICLFCEV